MLCTEQPSRPGATQTYVFDLSEFEEGSFTATRFPAEMIRPRNGWVCAASSDQEALALAIQAAFVEWPTPHRRLPEQFTVAFVDPEPEPPVGAK